VDVSQTYHRRSRKRSAPVPVLAEEVTSLQPTRARPSSPRIAHRTTSAGSRPDATAARSSGFKQQTTAQLPRLRGPGLAKIALLTAIGIALAIAIYLIVVG
jgi:hypothetical protein